MPRLGHIISVNNAGPGIDRVFQPFKTFKRHHPFGRHYHLRSGAWVAAAAAFSSLDLEFTEATNFNVLTGFKRAFDDFDQGIYGMAGFFHAKSRMFGHGPDEICFRKGHGGPAFKKLKE